MAIGNEEYLPPPPANRSEEAKILREWLVKGGYGELESLRVLSALNEDYLSLPQWKSIRTLRWPTEDELTQDGEIPNKHWRYRFYRIVARILGWRERRDSNVEEDKGFPKELLEVLIEKTWPPEVYEEGEEASGEALQQSTLVHTEGKGKSVVQENSPSVVGTETTSNSTTVVDCEVPLIGVLRDNSGAEQRSLKPTGKRGVPLWMLEGHSDQKKQARSEVFKFQDSEEDSDRERSEDNTREQSDPESDFLPPGADSD